MDDKRRNAPLGVAGWAALLVLMGLLAVAGWYAVHAWLALSGVAMSGAGWLFLVLGVVVTVAVGAGLMWLVFYSSRHNYDQ